MMTTSLNKSDAYLEDTKPSEVENFKVQNEEVNLLQIIFKLQERWKLIVSLTFIGCLISLLVALILPKVFINSVRVSLPSDNAVVVVNGNGLSEFTSLSLFKQFYAKVRSESHFKQFIFDSGYLAQLYPAKYVENLDEQAKDILFAKLVKTFKVRIDEPLAPKGGYVSEPTQISYSLQHGNEKLLVKLLSDYTNYTNDVLFTELEKHQKLERQSRISVLERKASLLKTNAYNERQLLIKKIETDNHEKLTILKQKKQIAIMVAAQDRETRIATLEEEQQRKLNELELKKELLIAKAKEDKATEIAKAKEALVIAKSLNIVHPTRLENLNIGEGQRSNGETNISLYNEYSQPLYLMGTKYLVAFIDTLNAREDEAIFLEELNQLNSDISQVKQDQELKSLKSRSTDEPYLVELNQLNAEIKAIEDDRNLAALKRRQSDEPYIEELPLILNKIAELNTLSMNFGELQAFSLVKAAQVTGIPLKPNRKVVVIIGALFSIMLSVAFTLLLIALRSRNTHHAT